MKDQRPQSPIFVKTYDFLLWLIPLTLKFPKSQRFLLAERLSKMALDFYDLILAAVMEPERQDERLDEADNPDNRNNNIGFRCAGVAPGEFLKGQVCRVYGRGASAEREKSRSVPGWTSTSP